MELAEQYWNLKGEVANILNAIRELSNDSIDNSFNANNAEQDELEAHIDELLRVVKYLRNCRAALELRLP